MLTLFEFIKKIITLLWWNLTFYILLILIRLNLILGSIFL
jgi:hypothetical protein